MNTGVRRALGGIRRALFTRASHRLEKRLQVGDQGWLFVLGVNNSGSTILTKVLESHPQIRALPQEGQLLTDAFPRPDHLDVVRNWSTRLDLFRWTEEDDPYPALSDVSAFGTN